MVGRTKEAIRSCERSLRFDPENAIVKKNAGGVVALTPDVSGAGRWRPRQM
jgi:hypothetical protein